ncbi:centrosomal protein of 104 kDa isoform X2 [Drosophila guanche]|uniref:Blast:Centrosomal protein of 104 kDa n=2 Tax=Drosophila guanche TaxID=7266 RepID=A0A3B0K8F7_DROGU|nr:centrosomal protein of 104 kDa isoform X2 [Drosophila guanche]SPP82329.1 blast:Centrosomal protein of 104 kDa [Drosophila guanche]
MAKKIPFNVVFASDEDVNFPASELNTHGPTVHGWRSTVDGSLATHDIILRFQQPAKIYRIQLLAHQYLIPEKVELWLHYSPKSLPSTPSSQYFDFLGFVALADNANTNYKSRELQSVTVTPRRGTHLKLRLIGSQKNEYNNTGQISLLAVNVLGEDLDVGTSSNGNGEEHIGSEAPPLDTATGELALASICDDLLFSMYVEESIVKYIRELEQRKTLAVSSERFEYARKLKLCMTALRTAGERLGRYSLAKRQAVQQEDFTTAKLRKEQMEMYRAAVLRQLQVQQLLETQGVQSSNDQSCEIYAGGKPSLPPAPSLQEVAHALAEAALSPKSIASQDDKSSTDGSLGQASNESVVVVSAAPVATTAAALHATPSHATGWRKSHDEIPQSPRLPSRHSSPMCSRQGSLRRRNKSVPRNSYEDYEERAIPTLRQECQGNALLEADPNRGRSRLNDRERRQAALPILVFGSELVEQFYSRQFQDREDGLMRLRDFLKELEVVEVASNEHAASPNKVARSAALLLHRAVRDAVYSVFSQATETVRVLFLEYVPGRVSPSEVARCVDRLLPELLAKSGDPSARLHTLAQHTILSIAACPEVAEQSLVAPALSRSVGSGTHQRLAMSRLQMLEQLVHTQGISTDKHSGLTCRALSECGCSGIHHPAEPVRKVAERILLLVYKLNPRMVRKQLPPDDDITRRNLLYRQLFTEFDKLDLERKQELLEGSKYVGDAPTPLADKPTTSSDASRLLKSKSGQALGLAASSSNGYASCNGKQQYNEQLKRSMLSASNSRKGSASNSESTEDNTPKIRCPFCDWSCAGSDATQLDRHYWKACPFLTKCPQCSQVLEVAALNYHLTTECDAKESYVVCVRCTESVHKQLYELHQMEDYCRELKTGAARCPLCHDDVHLPLDGGWKLHLLSAAGCPGNIRKKNAKKSN